MDADDVVHLVPADDLIEHEVSAWCVCGPRLDYVFLGPVSEVTCLHFALDGREHFDPSHDRDRCEVCRADDA